MDEPAMGKDSRGLALIGAVPIGAKVACSYRLALSSDNKRLQPFVNPFTPVHAGSPSRAAEPDCGLVGGWGPAGSLRRGRGGQPLETRAPTPAGTRAAPSHLM
jgi:hypothetical protein